VKQTYPDADGVSAKEPLEDDVGDEEKEEEGQSAEPATDIKRSDVRGPAQGAGSADKNLADQKSAQDEEQFHAVKSAVAEEPQRFAEVRVKHHETVRADNHHDGRGPEQIEAEDAAGFGGTIHFFFRCPTISLFQVRGSTRVR